MHNDAFHACEPSRDMPRIGIGLENVFALNVEALERPIDGSIEHVRNTQARLVIKLRTPQRLEHRVRGVFRDVAVARKFMRERAHVA